MLVYETPITFCFGYESFYCIAYTTLKLNKQNYFLWICQEILKFYFAGKHWFKHFGDFRAMSLSLSSKPWLRLLSGISNERINNGVQTNEVKLQYLHCAFVRYSTTQLRVVKMAEMFTQNVLFTNHW